MKTVILLFLNLYQYIFSRGINPTLFGSQSCRFEPTCSEYAKQAVEKFGVKKGFWLSARRIFACRPGSRFGYDPVEEK